MILLSETMVSLRDRGIYALPDGNEYIVYFTDKGKACLYDCRYGTSSTPVYVLNELDEVLDWHSRKRVFGSSDMFYTGRTF